MTTLLSCLLSLATDSAASTPDGYILASRYAYSLRELGLVRVTRGKERWVGTYRAPAPSVGFGYRAATRRGSPWVALMTGEPHRERLVALDLRTGRSRALGGFGAFSVGVGPGPNRVYALRRVSDGAPPALEVFDAATGTRRQSVVGVRAAFGLAGGDLVCVCDTSKDSTTSRTTDKGLSPYRLGVLRADGSGVRWPPPRAGDSLDTVRRALDLYGRLHGSPYAATDAGLALSPDGTRAVVGIVEGVVGRVEDPESPTMPGGGGQAVGECWSLEPGGVRRRLPIPYGPDVFAWLSPTVALCREEGSMNLLDLRTGSYRALLNADHGEWLLYWPLAEARGGLGANTRRAARGASSGRSGVDQPLVSHAAALFYGRSGNALP